MIVCTPTACAQDAATGAIRGMLEGPDGKPLARATVTITNDATGIERSLVAEENGGFTVQLLPPGEYTVQAGAGALKGQSHVRVHLEGAIDVRIRLSLAARQETIDVTAEAGTVESRSSAVSAVIDEEEIAGLPLNGRRFTDLALLTPGVTQDPRGLTSSSNGDLSFGGIRGVYSSFLVDGADNNNSFFAQARGRYRAPYQFSNEVVQEFRVSSNTYGADLGRAGGAVINVATKSGTNRLRGSAFYYLRDSAFAARHPFVDFKPQDRQHQFGFTIGGPIRKNRVFFFAGFDQHLFRFPSVVRFLTGSSVLAPSVNDFELSDYNLVLATSQALSKMGGEFRSQLQGNAGFMKIDVSINPRQYLTLRLNTSRYSGNNNVFFDPSSPVTTFAISENGEERVRTESGVLSLTSAVSFTMSNQLRAQFSRDVQESSPNAAFPRTRIFDVIDAFGRSSILPRSTREHKLHLTDTLTLETHRHSLKFGADFLQTWIENFFPLLFGGQYIFDDIDVNPFTFAPEFRGLTLTPLRAYAHGVPRYYSQNFGSALSNPDTRDYAAFAQDTLRLTDRLALSLGLRYDYQSFRTDRLVSNPLWPDSGRLPSDTNNFSPRLGFAYRVGEERPLVVRGGFGLFYPHIPSIYPSAVETENGINRTHVLLDNSDILQRQLFPRYPAALVNCPLSANQCTAPASLAGLLTADISAFARNFQTPVVTQASLGVEREIASRLALGASYLYVHGEHLIRARDVNLPTPVQLSYPVFDQTDSNFTGEFYNVNSFSRWQLTPTTTCGAPPCLVDAPRPIPQLGSIDVFESAASSVYHGLTVSARRRMTRGLYFRLAYTWAKAIDDGQDALVVGRPATVENAYSPQSERGLSVTDQRHRFVFSWIAEPRLFHRGNPALMAIFNHWTIGGVVSAGSGRPVNARVLGDANGDGNTSNDRLPGYRRNSFTGPTYSTTDLRLKRRFPLTGRLNLELLAESFNLFNQANKRLDITDDGFVNSAASFVSQQRTVSGIRYPAHYRRDNGFLVPTNAYAPRQVQFSARLIF
ncbi:MAG TPA: TonB-dependent receptor [Terriglobales bacterium]|nr:TonB-dependent receptor [Terriglobales bacterium]